MDDDTELPAAPAQPDTDGSGAVLDGLIEAHGLLEATPECLVVAAVDGRIVFANHRMQDLCGFSSEDLLDRPVGELVSAGSAIDEAGVGQPFDGTCHRKDGREVPVEVHLGVVQGRGGRYLVVTLRDVSELRSREAARFEAEAKYLSLVEGIPAITYIDPVDENQSSIYVSPQVTELLGLSQQEWLDDPYCWRHHVHPEDEARAWDEYVEAYRNGRSLSHEYRMVHEDGHVVWVSEQAFIIRDEDGEPWLIQGVIFDITERKNAEEQVAFLAYHDKLTGLPNRVLFEEMLELSIARARRHELGVGVLFLDLDNFKLVNDSLGHHAGDELLVQLAVRLRGCTRDTDLVARQGGDEFLLLLSDLERTTGTDHEVDPAFVVAASVAERVREALAEPFTLGGTQFYATASLGVSLYPNDAHDAHSLLRNADSAMYQSKKAGPGDWVLYSESGEDPAQTLSLTTRLRRAVEAQDWVLHYQPIVELSTGVVRAVEALIRWRDPGGGMVAPGEFIPLAEELGLIEAIGDWVLDQLVRQDAAWRREGIELDLSFNLSPRQLWSPHLAEKILGKLSAGDLDPHRVIIEITESTAMSDPDRTQAILAELHAWGLRLAIDDFGTGYSSLSRLNHLPVDVLKIDRTFVRGVDRDQDLGSMVQAMVQLAKNLGMTPLAEGIETAEELAFIIEHGCPLGQGFFLARPMPPTEVPAIVRGSRTER
jgi:diguanylate cyclase (GGDEF)-like protein/PAS domain S-box-containing protein